ncbi:MAG: nucleotidyl transferase AbiEii/AbiGii toxin family protein [Micrococcales bacterium]|nr:nucleotidyl transferase AbiEii/AbiGii toxin family protein [Micrococcales bacterium]
MSSPDGYATGVALWRAVTDRAKAVAKASGADSGAVVRRFVFERFLARVFHDPSAPWVLKGGTAVLARVHDARTTKDVDLLRQLSDLDGAVEALTAAAGVDLGDHFRFVIVTVERSTGGQPGVDGCRVTVDAYVGATKKVTFGVDLVTGSLMTAAPETVTDAVLDLRGLEAPAMRLYPVVDHIADKLCATQAMYGAGGDQPSSRVRDLVDLVVLARSQDVDGSALISAVEGEWVHRGLPGSPVFDPPSDWERRYPPEARRAPATADMTAFADAVALVGTLLAPVLDGSAAGRRWIAADLIWR